MNSTEQHRTLQNAYHAVRNAKLKLLPVEEAIADSISPDTDDLLELIGEAHDLLDKAAALTRHLADQKGTA